MRIWLPVFLMAFFSLGGAASAQSTEAEQQIEQALSALRPGIQISGRDYPPQSLEELMRQHGIPGASVAVFRDGQIIYAGGFGVTEAGQANPVTPDTLFQAASISKPVTATAALALAEQGKLDLDAPVNQALRSWRIPESAAAEGEPVTLRRLLTHTAGLTVHGFPGYAAGAPLPSVPQVLDGLPPANTPAVRIDQRPGAQWRYSGGGFTVAQLLMTDVTGEAFPGQLQRLVLDPAGMKHSTFAQPLPSDRSADAAAGHVSSGATIEGRYHTYPEMAAAGLWTTPSDLARWALAISSSFNGTEGGVLRPDTAQAMLTPGLGNWGLGVTVMGEGEWLRFTHDGANEGFRATLVAFPRRGEGIAIMTNSDAGERLFAPVTIAVAQALGWPGWQPRVLVPVPVPEQALAEIAGSYSAFSITVTVSLADGTLRATVTGNPKPSELVPIGKDLFAAEDGAPLQFVRGADGHVTALAAGGASFPRVGGTP